jgi:hypothetical protein
MQDTYFTVDDSLKLYNSKAKTDLYGCIYKTKNQFKFMSKLDFYDTSLRLHLVKLTDQNKNVRELINDTTNNKLSVDKTSFDFDFDEGKPIVEEDANLFTRHKPSIKYGKILEDDQYSDPNTTDLKNIITTNFLTSLECKLTDSIRFRDEARIVHTWERTLTPGSICEFNIENHLGKGSDY